MRAAAESECRERIASSFPRLDFTEIETFEIGNTRQLHLSRLCFSKVKGLRFSKCARMLPTSRARDDVLGVASAFFIIHRIIHHCSGP